MMFNYLICCSDTLKIKMVAGETCSEIIGECVFCEAKCNKRYPGSTFDCEPSKDRSGFSSWVCFFKCPRQCKVGAGRCSANYGPECCNKNCASKYNNGSGYTVIIVLVFIFVNACILAAKQRNTITITKIDRACLVVWMLFSFSHFSIHVQILMICTEVESRKVSPKELLQYL